MRLPVIGVLASVVGAYYYLRIVKLMWFDEATGEFARVSGALRLVFGLSGLFVIAYVLIGGPIGGGGRSLPPRRCSDGFRRTAPDIARRFPARGLLGDVVHQHANASPGLGRAMRGKLWVTAERQTGRPRPPRPASGFPNPAISMLRCC